MTKQMKPWEFKQYITANRPKQVKFSSDSQKWFDHFGVAPTCCLSFPFIDVGINPTYIRIFDSTNTNWIYFDGVKYINIEKAIPEATKVKFRIFCESPLQDSDPSSREYTVWAE